jgi:aryl-alcohol dehydrogenase-like predicted oxidoreductase
MDDLVSRGLVRYVGVSNWHAWRIAKALGISERRGFARFETVQAYYSIAGRDLERDIVPMMNEEKLGLMVWSPLAGGLLSGKYGPGAPGNGEGRRASFDFPPVDKDKAWACVAVMREIAEKHGVSVATVALAYVLAKPFVTTRDHRCQAHRAARPESRRDIAEARCRRSEKTGRGQRTGAGISRLDAGPSGRRPPSGAV